MTTDGSAPDATLYLHPKTLARLGSFELRAKMIVEGVMSGAHRSPYQGVSIEFAQHRPYVAGDDTRRLDWRVYARTDRLQVKEFEQETNLDLVVLVDSSGSMNYGSRSFADASGSGRATSLDGRTNWTKFDHATATAAALAYITLHQGDRVGLVVFADEIRAMVARSGQRSNWRQIVNALSTQPVDAPTNLGRAVDQAIGKVTNRCLFAIVSDFFSDPGEIRAALARLKHRGHDVICFQTIDRAEETFSFNDAAPFEGLEGEGRLRVDPHAIRAAYLEALGAHEKELERLCRGMGFDLQRVCTHEWLGPALGAFVARRNTKRKRTAGGGGV